jgi:hypothetical protein
MADWTFAIVQLEADVQEFSLIEVNGAGSEPTHMYDPRHSLLNAWKEIVKHWIILWREPIEQQARN